MHNACKQELRRPGGWKPQLAKPRGSGGGRLQPTRFRSLWCRPSPTRQNSTQELIGGFPSSYLKADDRIRTGDVQLGKLTFYH